MAGRELKSREDTTGLQDQTKLTEETKALFDEATGRMATLEHDDLNRDAVYRELVAEIEQRTKAGKSQYPAELKLQVALAYVVGRTSRAAERLTGVKAATIRRWKSTAPWWPRAIEIAKVVDRERIDSTFQEIQDKANKEVIDRVESGDYVFNKAGDLVRKPISGKELMTISAIARDKQSVLRGQPTNISEKVSDNDRMADLANTILDAVKKGNSKVIEGVVIKDDDN